MTKGVDIQAILKTLPSGKKAEAKAVFAMLGLTKDNDKHQRLHNENLPKMEEYNLIISCECTTCLQVTEYWFRMTFNPESWGLVSVPINMRPEEYKSHKTKTDICGKCEEYLMSMSVFDLVNRIFEIVLANRKIPSSLFVLPRNRRREVEMEEA